MSPHQKAAHEIIHEYYFMLPNNGSLNHGLLSCNKRYKEAVQCALVGIKRLILTLEFMSTESNDPAIMDRINFYDEVQSEVYKIKDGDIITVDTSQGKTGFVYSGKAEWQVNELDFRKIKMPKVNPMLILADPDKAYKYSFYPWRC